MGAIIEICDVDGHTFIHIGAEKHDVVINYVFGGNDISGTIGSSTVPSEIKKASENGQRSIVKGLHISYLHLMKV